MRLPTVVALVLALAGTARAAPTSEALVQQARAQARPVTWQVRLDRQDDRFLSGLQPGAAPLQGTLSCTRDRMDFVLELGGASADLLTSRDGQELTFEGLVRVGSGATVAEPSPPPPPVPEVLGYREFTRQTAEPVPAHPLLMLWPWALRPPLPGERFDGAPVEDVVGGTPCWRVTLHNHEVRERVWLRQADLQVLRTERTSPALGATYGDDGVQVTLDLRPLYRATFRPGEPVAPQVLRRPTPAPPAQPLPRNTLLVVLAGALAFLLLRLLRFRLQRGACSREILLLDTPDGAWGRTLERLGYPVEPFDLETASRELQSVGPGLTADTTATSRAIVVAPGMADRKLAFLLRSFVEGGGRVMLLAQTHDLPGGGDLVELPVLRALRTDPAGPWRRTTFEEVGPYAARSGTGAYYPSADRELLVAEAGRRGVVAGVLRRGQGEWHLCQLALQGPVGERVLQDLLDYLQARRDSTLR